MRRIARWIFGSNNAEYYRGSIELGTISISDRTIRVDSGIELERQIISSHALTEGEREQCLRMINMDGFKDSYQQVKDVFLVNKFCDALVHVHNDAGTYDKKAIIYRVDF